MLSIKVNDIVREQRRNIISGLFLASFWLISSTGYYETLNRQELLELLTTFLGLKDTYQNDNRCNDSDEFCHFFAKVPWGLDSAYLTFVTGRQYRCPNLPEDQIVRRFLMVDHKNPSLPYQNFFCIIRWEKIR
jgi:hypothetical protein